MIATNAVSADEVYAKLSLGQLQVSKTNPRRRLDDAKLKELAASLREKGVLEPLLVRPSRVDPRRNSDKSTTVTVHIVAPLDHPDVLKGGIFEIVAGERRFKAAQLAKLASVPCLIRDYSDADALECQVVENDQREDLHPLDRAEGYQALLNTGRYKNVEDLAAKLGKSRRAVYQCLQLRKLDAKVQQQFSADAGITATHAALLARLQPADQLRAVKEQFSRGAAPSTRQLEEWIHRDVHLDLAAAAFPLDDAGAVKSSQLASGARACTECPKRSGANPDLFPDLKEKNICTDPNCYHSKERTFIKIQLEGTYLVLGSGNKKNARGQLPGTEVPREMLSVGQFYGRKPKGLTGWSPAGKKACKDTVEGVIVEDEYTHSDFKLGQVLRACTNPRCRTHHPGAVPPLREKPAAARTGSRKSTAADLRKFEQQQLEQRITAMVNQELLDAAPRPIAGMDWQFLIKAALDVIQNDGQGVPALEEVLKARWQVPLDYYTAGYAQKITGKHPEKKHAAILSDLLRFAAIAVDYDFEDYREEILARYGVNQKAIARKVAADQAREQKDIAALTKQAIQNTAHVDAKKGACWCCGCTDSNPCVRQDPEDDGGGAFPPCAWVDKGKKLCSNPDCIRKAASLPPAAGKKGKKEKKR